MNKNTLQNGKKSMFIVFMITIIFGLIIPEINVSSTLIIDQESDYGNGKNFKITNQENNFVGVDNNSSFHTSISGQKFWLIVKTTLSDPYTVISTSHKCHYSSNNSKTNFIMRNYQGEYEEESTYYSNELIRWFNGSNVDRYFQIGFGRFYWGRYHYDTDFINWGNNGHTFITDSGDTHYFTFIIYTNEAHLDVWINTTQNATFSTTSGTDVFKVEREDFIGNLNIGRKRRTIILNGEKEIQINNTMFAWFETAGLSNGFELLEYQTPTGKSEYKYQVDKQGNTEIINQSEDFRTNLFLGTNGKWKFNVKMMNIGLEKLYPNIHLYGADIKFPY